MLNLHRCLECESIENECGGKYRAEAQSKPCKQLFLRGQHRRKLCQNADEPDDQAEEYAFFQWMSLNNSTVPDETPRSQVAWNRSAATGGWARKPCI